MLFLTVFIGTYPPCSTAFSVSKEWSSCMYFLLDCSWIVQQSSRGFDVSGVEDRENVSRAARVTEHVPLLSICLATSGGTRRRWILYVICGLAPSLHALCRSMHGIDLRWPRVAGDAASWHSSLTRLPLKLFLWRRGPFFFEEKAWLTANQLLNFNLFCSFCYSNKL